MPYLLSIVCGPKTIAFFFFYIGNSIIEYILQLPSHSFGASLPLRSNDLHICSNFAIHKYSRDSTVYNTPMPLERQAICVLFISLQ